jgi:hypothetical protein
MCSLSAWKIEQKRKDFSYEKSLRIKSLELEAGGLLRLHLGSETTGRVFGHRWETLSDVPIFMARER